jgi:hypothetical protein
MVTCKMCNGVAQQKFPMNSNLGGQKSSVKDIHPQMMCTSSKVNSSHPSSNHRILLRGIYSPLDSQRKRSLSLQGIQKTLLRSPFLHNPKSFTLGPLLRLLLSLQHLPPYQRSHYLHNRYYSKQPNLNPSHSILQLPSHPLDYLHSLQFLPLVLPPNPPPTPSSPTPLLVRFLRRRRRRKRSTRSTTPLYSQSTSKNIPSSTRDTSVEPGVLDWFGKWCRCRVWIWTERWE